MVTTKNTFFASRCSPGHISACSLSKKSPNNSFNGRVLLRPISAEGNVLFYLDQSRSGQVLLGPINSTRAKFDLGHFLCVCVVCVMWVCYEPVLCCVCVGWEPKGGGPKGWRHRGVRAQRGGGPKLRKRGGPKEWGARWRPEWWEAKKFALLFTSPIPFSLFFPLGRPSRGIAVADRGHGPPKVCLWASLGVI